MKNILFILLTFLSVSFRLYAQDVIKIGIIGLDTSHSTAFTELLNGDSDDKFVKEFEVVAAYPYGSKTIQSSYERIPGYIEEVKKHGVEITSSIAELLDKVDCVMLETNDGSTAGHERLAGHGGHGGRGALERQYGFRLPYRGGVQRLHQERQPLGDWRGILAQEV